MPSEGFVTGGWLKTIVFGKTFPTQSLHIANCTLLIEKALPSEGFVTGGFHRTHVKTFPISDSFTMNIGFEAESYQQFIEEVVENQPNQFKPQDYADAFNRILMDIQCCQCGKITPQWVNLELS